MAYNTVGLPDVVKEAIERYELEDVAMSPQRQREQDDLEFQIPEKQWPDAIRQQRGEQVINGVRIPAQPMLSIPTLDQPIQLILNQERSAHLAVTVHALSEDADDDTAEAINDIYRGIQRDSHAGVVRSWAFQRAVLCGRGAYRIVSEPDPSGRKGDLRLSLKRLLYQESAKWDVYAQEPDFSDADWAFVSTWLPFSTLKRRYPDSKLKNYDDGAFAELCKNIPQWVRDNGKGKACLVVEYFRKVYGDSGEDDDYVIRWSKLTCMDELDSADMDQKNIPLVPTIGRELIPFDDERYWVGMVGPNKDAVRLTNYAASNAVSIAALEPKAPWMIAEGQDENHEQEFQLSNVRNFPALHYRPTALGGNLVPPPARTQVDISRLGPSMQLLQMGQQLTHTGTGAFEAALGQATPNAKTKGGTLALQQQHDQGNSNWLDNQVEITLAREAEIILNWIPYIYDRPGRIIRGLDVENKSKPIMVNAPFTMQNGKPVAAPPQAGAMGAPPTGMPPQPGSVLGLQQPAPKPKVKHYDLSKGKYGVTASAGKSYKSRVEEGSDRLGQLLQAEPALVPILGPNWMHFQEFPGHQEAERILRKMRDHQMPWLADEDEQPDAASQLAAAKAQMAQMQQQLQGAARAIETEQAKQKATIAKAQMDAATSVALQKMKDATAITVAQINALVKGVQLDSEAANEAAALGEEAKRTEVLAHGAVHDRAHDIAMAAQEHAHQLEAAQQQHEHALAAAEQGQAHALEQGDQGHAAALEQQQQAADLAPEPAAGDDGA